MAILLVRAVLRFRALARRPLPRHGARRDRDARRRRRHGPRRRARPAGGMIGACSSPTRSSPRPGAPSSPSASSAAASAPCSRARRHDGPLVVQKPLYPEGDAVCHAIVVHPPGGIAGRRRAAARARASAPARHALLTTPGAAKWYRSAGPRAREPHRAARRRRRRARMAAAGNHRLRRGARRHDHARRRSRGDARYLGWEILCLGRTGSGERFDRGEVLVTTEIARDGKPLFIDRAAHRRRAARCSHLPPALPGAPVVRARSSPRATTLDANHVAACRDDRAARAARARSRACRACSSRATSALAARPRADWFTRAVGRAASRPSSQRAAVEPRIWRT